jgi:hypothetical protein
MNKASRALQVAAIAIALCGAALTGSDVQPTNDLPNPYQTVAPWGNLPDGRLIAVGTGALAPLASLAQQQPPKAIESGF